MYLLCMLILSSCSDDVCRVDGKMSDFQGGDNGLPVEQNGEFTHDTLMQTVMKDGVSVWRSLVICGASNTA